MKKRIGTLLMALCMLLALLAGCQSDTPASSSGSPGSTGTTTTGGDSSIYPDLTPEEAEAIELGLLNLDGTMPIIPDPDAFEEKYGQISMFFRTQPSRVKPVDELEMVKMWEEITGIRFAWQEIPIEGAAEKINLILSSADDLPDCFYNFTDGASSKFVIQYADQDIFIPTEQIIEDYMPVYKELLDSVPQYRLEATAPDGHIYGFPYIEEMFGLVLVPGPFVVNEDWLRQVGKEVPTTVDEWVDVLRAFRDGGDLNGNGIDDEIPMATWFSANNRDTFGSMNLFYRFTGCFGMADSYCAANSYADHLRRGEDGQVFFSATHDAFRKTAEFFHDLWEEGLIWNGSFEAEESINFVNSLLKEDTARVGTYGAFGGKDEISSIEVRNQYTYLPRLAGEAGYTGYRLNYSELQDSSNTAITTECDFPHAIALWLEHIASDPKLSVMSNWGTPGSVFVEEEDGYLTKPRDENGNTIPQGEFADRVHSPRENTTPCRGSFIIKNTYFDTVVDYDAPSLREGQEANGKEEILAEFEDVVLPRVLTTVEEASRLAQIQPTISDIVNRYLADWIINGVDDTSWNNYQNELALAGVDELVEIWQTAIDRAERNS